MLLGMVVFIGVFLVTALLITASGTDGAQRMKRTLERLNAIVAADLLKSKDGQVNVRKQELFSAIPLLNRILSQVQIAPKLSRLIYQADLPWTPGGLLLVSLTCWLVGGYLIYLKTGVLVFSFIMGLIPAAAPFTFLLQKRAQRFEKFEEVLPQALDLMVNALRSGQSLVASIGLVAREVPDPIGREFRICYEEQNYGLELRDAMENLALRVPIQDVRVIMTAILIQKESGGNLAEVLDKCSYVIRERFRLKREIRVKTAQGRMTGWILTILPIFLGVLMYIANPKGISLLWQRPLGLKMLYSAIGMTLLGGVIIRRIVRVRV